MVLNQKLDESDDYYYTDNFIDYFRKLNYLLSTSKKTEWCATAGVKESTLLHIVNSKSCRDLDCSFSDFYSLLFSVPNFECGISLRFRPLPPIETHWSQLLARSTLGNTDLWRANGVQNSTHKIVRDWPSKLAECPQRGSIFRGHIIIKIQFRTLGHTKDTSSISEWIKEVDMPKPSTPNDLPRSPEP